MICFYARCNVKVTRSSTHLLHALLLILYNPVSWDSTVKRSFTIVRNSHFCMLIAVRASEVGLDAGELSGDHDRNIPIGRRRQKCRTATSPHVVQDQPIKGDAGHGSSLYLGQHFFRMTALTIDLDYRTCALDIIAEDRVDAA